MLLRLYMSHRLLRMLKQAELLLLDLRAQRGMAETEEHTIAVVNVCPAMPWLLCILISIHIGVAIPEPLGPRLRRL